MATHRLRLTEPRPFFAEMPYYLWGQVNYDSEGDCKSPTDRQWAWLDLTNRETREHLDVRSQGDDLQVVGDDPLAARAALFLVSRCNGEWISSTPAEHLQGWDHEKAAARAARVQEEFERPELRPFDVAHWFWGSWKWVGWFATEFTWVGRWIMHSVQSQALRYALGRLTGRSFATDREWVDWYFAGGGIQEYPEPDFKQWHTELKEQVVIAGPGAAPDGGGT
jgi:hypothetical protein